MKLLRFPLFAFTLATAVCGAEFVRELSSPAAPDSQCPNLTAAPDGTLYLTYYGPSPNSNLPSPTRALWLASLAPGAAVWSAPRPIVSSPLLMENWADFASLVVGTDGALTAQWFQKSTPDAGGYEGWFSRSENGGRTWRAPARLGHEFVVLAPLSGGRTLAVWLESARQRDPNAVPRPKRDPNAKRDPAATPPARDPSAPYAASMKLLSRILAPDGTTLAESTIDPDVCTCCQNTLAVLPDGRVFVAYRGHTADEIRDNQYAIFDGKAWSAPRTLRDDGWKIAACPVNGPAADARGNAFAVAWFTAAENQPRVFASRASDWDKSLGAPIQIDLGRPMGRIETVVLADSSALILWMETGTAENAAGIYARRLFSDGKLSAARLVADSSQARASGFPRAALRPSGRVVMSWTQAGEINQVRALELDSDQLTPVSRATVVLPIRSGPPMALEFCTAPLTISLAVH